MGRGKQEIPIKLAGKLKIAREKLGYTQAQMCEAIRKYNLKIYPGYIGLYEVGERLPSLLILLAYSKITKIKMEDFVDDSVEI